MKLASILSYVCIASIPVGCGKSDGTPSPVSPAGTAEAPSAAGVKWDDPAKASDIDWPMEGAQAMPVVGASAFGRGATVGEGAQGIWKRLTDYRESFLRSWRQALSSPDEAPASDVVDAFNELAIAVTGPGGFWRKTVPKSWLGCGELAESAPCKKMAELEKELAQWDEVQKQIENLAPERATQFLARNESRIMLYLDTYVPDEPSAEAMKETAFYKKNLAAVMDGWSEGGGGVNMKDL